ncbi:acyl-CoA thioesterase [Leisingera sp. ANG-M1]|uniref:acyl-CoA thioesterase n=1 Tax=Leisingera sp. ANG-M1 TaxID=1577895 RepID=UPI000691267F|nr:thioesterase family protein [Leisingera sp. ANG-M1]
MTTAEQSIQQARPRPLSTAGLPAGLWSMTHVFRHGQCDPAGIVYTPKFFDVFNQVIEAWFCKRLGIGYYEIIGPRRTGLGYVNAAATFFTPCMMGEKVEIFVAVTAIGSKSYQLQLHAMKNGREALRGNFTTVTTCLDEHQAIPIPPDIKAALAAYAEHSS